MKKHFTTILALLGTTTFFAQIPSITSTNQIPTIGDTINYINANTFGFDIAGSGGVVDVNWDYQALSPTTTVDIWYVDPTTTPETANFPTATVAMGITGSTGFEYFQNNANTIARLGYSGAQSIYYSAPFNRYEFPIDPGVSWNTSLYTGILIGLGAGEDSATIANGSYIANPDAYGTVTLPPATFGGQPEVFNDVVRVHVTESFQIIAWLFGTPVITINVNDDYYFWFDELTQEPILIYGTTTDDAGGSPQTVLRYQSIPGTGIATPNSIAENSVNAISVTPNPSNGRITIQSDMLKSASTVSVTNILGEMVYLERLNGKTWVNQINVSDLPKGIYILSISNEENKGSQRIIIE